MSDKKLSSAVGFYEFLAQLYFSHQNQPTCVSLMGVRGMLFVAFMILLDMTRYPILYRSISGMQETACYS
jgi:hypothetical protein